MSEEWKRISARLEKHEAMIGATNLALTALVSLLPKDQFEELMNRIARDSAVKQSFFEQSENPAAESKVRLLQEAEEMVAATLRQGHLEHSRNG
jgi:hypothetical protein